MVFFVAGVWVRTGGCVLVIGSEGRGCASACVYFISTLEYNGTVACACRWGESWPYSVGPLIWYFGTHMSRVVHTLQVAKLVFAGLVYVNVDSEEGEMSGLMTGLGG